MYGQEKSLLLVLKQLYVERMERHSANLRSLSMILHYCLTKMEMP